MYSSANLSGDPLEAEAVDPREEAEAEDPREALAVPMEWEFPAPARSPSILQFRIEKKHTKKYLKVINIRVKDIKKETSISSRSSDELGQDDIGLPV